MITKGNPQFWQLPATETLQVKQTIDSSCKKQIVIFVEYARLQSAITEITPQQAVEHSLRLAGLFNLKIPIRL